MLELKEVSKKYNSKYAVKRINLNIESGKLYLFVGENGSGKSTTIKLISKVIFTKEYLKFINDFKQINYLPDRRNYPKLLNTLDFLKYFLRKNEDFINENMIKYDLPNKSIGNLSKGNIQKLGILQVLLSEGDLYILDEPTDGLDKKSITLFIEDIKSLVNSGKTIIISTHKPLLYKNIYSITYKFDEGVCNEKKRRKKQTT